MKNIMISLGQRSIQGNYNTVFAAGELKVQNCTVRRLSCAGLVRITKSSLGKVRCAGEFIAEETGFTKLRATGDMRLTGICKGDIIIATGSITAQYLESRILCNGGRRRQTKKPQDGKGSFQGVFHAVTFENYSGINMDFEYRVKNIISYASLTSNNEIEGETFYSFSNLKASIINADRIMILAQGEVKVEEMTGETVSVKKKYQPDKSFKKLPKTRAYKHKNATCSIADIGCIEADQVDVEYIKAARISGDNVIVGDLCIIDRVEYRDSIRISDKAIVNEVVKL